MEEEQPKREEEVHGLKDAPFLTRASYEKELSRGTVYQLVVDAEQQADQQLVPPTSKNLCSMLAHFHMAMQIYKLASLLLFPTQ